MNAAINYNAKPEKVDDKITLNGAAFTLDAAQAEQPRTADSSAKTDERVLRDNFASVVNKYAKQLSPEHVAPAGGYDKFLDKSLNDPEQGPEYVKSLTVYIDQAFSRKDIAAKAHGADFISVADKIGSAHLDAWQAEKARIAEAHKAAAEAAVQKQAGAMQSLYALSGLFATFVTLILLVVLIRIERNLRGVAKPSAEAGV
ncbi:hypothetical protein [Paludibacterium purpuratum]|nr:hypothetical protein [Paludibacterium purpuratum]